MINADKNVIKEMPISGPQHLTIPTDMANTYGEIFEVIKKNFLEEKFSCFFPVRGQKYNQSIQLSRLTPFEGETFPTNEEEAKKYLEPAVRLMVVGRSVNGWLGLMEQTKDEFVQRAADTVVFGDMSWIEDNGQATNTCATRAGGKEYRYDINKSSFFRCVRRILSQMKPITTIEQRWFDHIVWSVLYPIAPLHSENIIEKLHEVQLEASKKLILQQIEFYKPTHILFLTDWDEEFEKFADIFPEVRKVEKPEKKYVVGMGTYGMVKVVVTIRPNRRCLNKPSEDEIVSSVCAAHNTISEMNKYCEIYKP